MGVTLSLVPLPPGCVVNNTFQFFNQGFEGRQLYSSWLGFLPLLGGCEWCFDDLSMFCSLAFGTYSSPIECLYFIFDESFFPSNAAHVDQTNLVTDRISNPGHLDEKSYGILFILISCLSDGRDPSKKMSSPIWTRLKPRISSNKEPRNSSNFVAIFIRKKHVFCRFTCFLCNWGNEASSKMLQNKRKTFIWW